MARVRPSKRIALTGALVIALLAGLWAAHNWWTTGRFIESTDDAYVGGNITPISPHIGGFIARIAVSDNQFVHAGQLLVQLDDRDMRAALDHAQAVTAERDAAIASLRARLIEQQSMVRQASAALDAKTARGVFLQQDARRYRTLAASRAASWQDAQRCVALDQQAHAETDSAHAALEAARQQLHVLQTDITQAAAAARQSSADLRAAQLNLAYTEIRAPVDGYVGNRAAQTGSYVATGAYLLSIVPADGLWVDANFKEDQLARMKPGMRADVTADILPGQVMHGHVLSLAPGTGAVFSIIPPENATGNFTKIVQRVPVRIGLDTGNATLGAIRPGLSIVVSVDTRAGS